MSAYRARWFAVPTSNFDSAGCSRGAHQFPGRSLAPGTYGDRRPGTASLKPLQCLERGEISLLDARLLLLELVQHAMNALLVLVGHVRHENRAALRLELDWILEG